MKKENRCRPSWSEKSIIEKTIRKFPKSFSAQNSSFLPNELEFYRHETAVCSSTFLRTGIKTRKP